MEFHPLFIPMLKRWESYQQKQYFDKGPDKPMAIGYGHTNANGLPPTVTEGMVLKDEAEAAAILENDLRQIYVPQLDDLFARIGFTAPTTGFYCGFLDVLYNRGYGRLEKSLAYDWLKRSDQPKYMIKAAVALVHSAAPGFVALDVAYDAAIGQERVYLGLQARRASDTALCLMERWA